jgi:hypothetical protein
MSETQKVIEALSVQTGVDEIDPAAIERFFLDTINGRSVDPADAMQAAVMLWAIRRGRRAGDNMNKELRALLGTKKINKGKFDFRPEQATMDSDAFAIVLRLLRDENFTEQDAVNEFGWYVAEDASPKTIDRWIKAIKPRAEKVVQLDQYIKSLKNGDKNR